MEQMPPTWTADDATEERRAFEDGRLYLLVQEGRYSPDWSGHVCAGRYLQARGAPHRTVHVISRPAGGEVRGYITIDGSPLFVRTPVNVTWDALDAEVSRRLGLPVVTREIAGDPGAPEAGAGERAATLK